MEKHITTKNYGSSESTSQKITGESTVEYDYMKCDFSGLDKDLIESLQQECTEIEELAMHEAQADADQGQKEAILKAEAECNKMKKEEIQQVEQEAYESELKWIDEVKKEIKEKKKADIENIKQNITDILQDALTAAKKEANDNVEEGIANAKKYAYEWMQEKLMEIRNSSTVKTEEENRNTLVGVNVKPEGSGSAQHTSGTPAYNFDSDGLPIWEE